QDTKGVGFYINYEGNILEHNLVDGCRAAGAVIQFNNPVNTIFRYNVVKNIGLGSPWPPPAGFDQGGVGINIGVECSNCQVYNNVFHDFGPSGGGCALIYEGVRNNYFVNNTCYAMEVGIALGLISGDNVSNNFIQNNIFADIPTPLLDN